MNEVLVEENITWIEKNIKQGLETCRNTDGNDGNCELELLRILESITLIKGELK